jgi:hypothetical protein
MIWFVAVDLKQIQHQGKKFRWSRPNACPRCHHWRIWGHGYALRYFAGFAEALPMKCYRCPSCRCVLTARPGAYFSRIRSCIALIVTCLTHRVEQGRWPPLALPRSRLRHWLANLERQVQIHLTNTWTKGLLTGYEVLLERGLIPVARVS